METETAFTEKTLSTETRSTNPPVADTTGMETLAVTVAVLVGGIALLAGGWWLRNLFRRPERGESNADRLFMQGVLDDCVVALTRENGATTADAATLQPALKNLIDQGTDSPCLAALLRIDYEIVKTAPREATLTISLLLRAPDGARKISARRTIRWEYLPNAIREEFIRTNVPSQAFTLFVREAASVTGGMKEVDSHA